MFRTGDLILAATMLMAGTAASIAGGGGTSTEKAFKAFGDDAVNGVWTTTDAKGAKEEAQWKWVLDKSFLQLRWKSGDASFEQIHGIDPATGLWAYWGFNSKGQVLRGTVKSEKKDESIWEDTGHGKDGPFHFKSRFTALTPDSTRQDFLVYTVNGKNLPLGPPQIWTRKK